VITLRCILFEYVAECAVERERLSVERVLKTVNTPVFRHTWTVTRYASLFCS